MSIAVRTLAVLVILALPVFSGTASAQMRSREIVPLGGTDMPPRDAAATGPMDAGPVEHTAISRPMAAGSAQSAVGMPCHRPHDGHRRGDRSPQIARSSREIRPWTGEMGRGLSDFRQRGSVTKGRMGKVCFALHLTPEPLTWSIIRDDVEPESSGLCSIGCRSRVGCVMSGSGNHAGSPTRARPWQPHRCSSAGIAARTKWMTIAATGGGGSSGSSGSGSSGRSDDRSSGSGPSRAADVGSSGNSASDGHAGSGSGRVARQRQFAQVEQSRRFRRPLLIACGRACHGRIFPLSLQNSPVPYLRPGLRRHSCACSCASILDSFCIVISLWPGTRSKGRYLGHVFRSAYEASPHSNGRPAQGSITAVERGDCARRLRRNGHGAAGPSPVTVRRICPPSK